VQPLSAKITYRVRSAHVTGLRRLSPDIHSIRTLSATSATRPTNGPAGMSQATQLDSLSVGYTIRLYAAMIGYEYEGMRTLL
jgi:hypothetical protein